MFPNVMNPAAMYNPGQFPNGSHSATPTPAFTNPTFTPGSVVPAKRPHDGMSGSPQPSATRSQTPSSFPQQYPNAPTPFQHLQQSNNNTPSPTMAQQSFRPPTVPPQQQGNFGNHMMPGTPQQSNAPPNMAQQAQMGGGWNPGMGMNNMGMGPMPGMPNQMNMMQNNNVQRAYQMRLMQQQEQLRRSGLAAPRAVGGQPNQMNAFGPQQPGGQMANGQMTAQMMASQANQQKREGFLKTLAQQAAHSGRHFNPSPLVCNKPVDLYVLWSFTMSLQGSQNVDRHGQWPVVAAKCGFPPAQFPTAAEEIKSLYLATIVPYERMYFQMRSNQKQQVARLHAQQMAGVSGPNQASPTRMMQPQHQQQQQFNQFQQSQQGQPPAHSTPMQANAQLPQNGMTTPQQMMQHRRSSSIRKPEQMTPQPGNQPMTAPSPLQKVQRSPSLKQEPGGPVMKSEEPQSTNYVPHMRSIEYDGGYDVPALFELGTTIAQMKPNMPMVNEMGVIDIHAITKSLASGISAEVRYALDALVIISRDERIAFELDKCDDLFDELLERAEQEVDTLSEEAAEVSDALDLPSYEDVIRGSRTEAESLQEVPEFGSQAYELDRAVDRLLAIATILHNFSFYEHNHKFLTSTPLVKWLSNVVRLLGTRNMLLRNFANTLDFYKVTVTLLSNITQGMELPGKEDALHLLHFLLAFAPQPSPSYTEGQGSLRFTAFNPAIHRFLPPAVDSLAKLLARQDPNRMLYRSLFTGSTSSLSVSESPLDLLTRAFALAISVLPDRQSKGTLSNSLQLRIVELRKAYLCQGMLAADILASLAPGNDTDLARAWIEAADGWAVGLLNLAALLSVDRTQPPNPAKPAPLGHDTESFKLITHRALSMMKRLAEKAGKGSVLQAVSNGMLNADANGEGDADDEAHAPKWEGIPQGHAILGALMMPNTDKVALGLLCGLHDMAMQT
jgi:SWI/SNF chromatin-remodeling complex subunit SWI1